MNSRVAVPITSDNRASELTTKFIVSSQVIQSKEADGGVTGSARVMSFTQAGSPPLCILRIRCGVLRASLIKVAYHV